MLKAIGSKRYSTKHLHVHECVIVCMFKFTVLNLSLVNSFSDISKGKYNNNLTIQALVQAQSCKSKHLGKKLANGCQFTNIFPNCFIWYLMAKLNI